MKKSSMIFLAWDWIVDHMGMDLLAVARTEWFSWRLDGGKAGQHRVHDSRK
jgi:hypothetical protein